MTAKEQSQAKEAKAIQDMINEGGLGADVYYINEGTDKENDIRIAATS
jgi:hypothetical protein